MNNREMIYEIINKYLHLSKYRKSISNAQYTL